jgi:hypothetical protein
MTRNFSKIRAYDSSRTGNAQLSGALRVFVRLVVQLIRDMTSSAGGQC